MILSVVIKISQSLLQNFIMVEHCLDKEVTKILITYDDFPSLAKHQNSSHENIC